MLRQRAPAADVGKAQQAGNSQRNHRNLNIRFKFVSAFANLPSVRKRTDHRIVKRIPQPCKQEHASHPRRLDSQHIRTECEEKCIDVQVYKAACHVSAYIPDLVSDSKLSCLFHKTSPFLPIRLEILMFICYSSIILCSFSNLNCASCIIHCNSCK